MKYKKAMETKLRHYSSINESLPYESTPIAATSLSVTEKLAKLRTEQARAATNKQQRYLHGESSSSEQQQITYDTHPRPGVSLFINEQQTNPQLHLPRQEHALRSAAGPPPPPSWTRSRQARRPTTTTTTTTPNNHISFQYYCTQHETFKTTTTSTIPSLVRICCWQMPTDYTSALYGSQRWINQIKKLPNHVKQRILFEWAFYDINHGNNRRLVTNATMDMFEKTEYEELWLEASQISLERLVRAFWKVNKVGMMTQESKQELADDWEDLLLEGNGHTTANLENTASATTNDDDHPPPTVMLHLDYQEEIGKWKYLSRVISVLQHRQQIESTTISPSYALSSPFLGRTLVSLNISFMRPAPSTSTPLCWTAFAHLVVSTLPHLHWLYSAGCFNSSQGLEVLSILSHGLRKLKFWDLGYYPWLQLGQLTSAIDWQRDLKELSTLCLSSHGSSHTPSSDIIQWFKDHQLARIKLIWVNI